MSPLTDTETNCPVCEDTQEIDCTDCDGSGMDDDGEICETCGGSGMIDCPECT